MSLKSKFFSVFTAAAATAALATFTFAQDGSAPAAGQEKKAERRANGEFGKGRMGGKRFGKMGMHRGMGMGPMHGIELTDAQKAQIKSIREANRPMAAFREEMQTIRQARRDGTITEAQKDRMKAIREEAMAKRKAVHEQIMAILTPEQRAQLEQRRTEMQQKREEFRQKRQEMRKQRRQNAPAAATNDTI